MCDLVRGLPMLLFLFFAATLVVAVAAAVTGLWVRFG
jgi:hypothetical protein